MSQGAHECLQQEGANAQPQLRDGSVSWGNGKHEPARVLLGLHAVQTPSSQAHGTMLHEQAHMHGCLR